MEVAVERVQTVASQLALQGGHIPPEYIRSDSEQPGATTFHGESPEIPVIDLAAGSDPAAAAEAAERWGIFQVVNHGIPREVMSELQRVGREFFELPQEEKERYAAEPGQLEGYGTKLRRQEEEKETAAADSKKAWVDFLFHKVWPPTAVNLAVWPKNPPTYREANEEYRKHLVRVVEQVLGLLSEGLGLEDGGGLKEALGGDRGMELLLKINYYPACPRPDLALGVVAHTDMSAITVLLPNHVQGLQVFKDGRWILANYIPYALIVHIGDQIQILSNGKYKSVLHRTTVNKESVRMSWPVFCTPPEEMVIGPLPQLCSAENPPKFKAYKYKEYQYLKINKLLPDDHDHTDAPPST